MTENYSSLEETLNQPMGGKVKEAVGQFTERVSVVGRTVAEKVEGSRAATATGLDKAASALHGNADKLAATATYVRNNDLNSMIADVTKVVKNNPGPSLLIAAGLGFIIARALNSRRD